MKNMYIFMAVIFLIAGGYALSGISYVINLELRGDELTSKSIHLAEGNGPDRIIQPAVGYNLSIFSFEGKILHSFKFLMETEPVYSAPEGWFDENGNQIIFSENKTYQKNTGAVNVLIVPYFPDANEIVIYNADNLTVLEIDVSHLADPRIAIPYIIKDFASKYWAICISAILIPISGISYMKIEKRI